MFGLRQSCDRCHEQKVRCIRDKSPAETGRDSSPCIRCRKARAICIYSMQLKPGRPAMNKDTSTPKTRKLPKSSDTPPVAPQPYLGSNYSDPSNCANMQLDPFFLPLGIHTGSNNTLEMGNQPVYEGIPFEEWAPHSSFKFPEISTGPTSMPYTSQAPFAAHTNGLFDNTCPMTGDTVMRGVESTGMPAGVDPTELHIEQLAELNLRTFRSTRNISTTSNAPLSTSSPYFNEIVETTGSLISILDHIAQLSTHAPNVQSKPFIPDLGAILMIIACYERLLSAFEKLCLSIQHRLDTMRISMNFCQDPSGGGSIPPTSHRQKASMAGSQKVMSGSTTQYVMMLELMSHLVERLDRALGPLAGLVGGNPSMHDDNYNGSSSDVSAYSASGSQSPVLPFASHNGLNGFPFEQKNNMQKQEDQNGYGGPRKVANDYRAAKTVIQRVSRHSKGVRAQMRDVRVLIRECQFT